MMRKLPLSAFLAFVLALLLPLAPVSAADKPAADKPGVDRRAAEAVSGILAAYEKKDAYSDWEAYGLLLNGKTLPKSYFIALDKRIKDAKGSFRAVTDCARLSLVYQAAGKDPAKAAGWDLVKVICSFDDVSKRGATGPIWALIALNGKTLPKDAKWNTELLAGEILKYQLPELKGGFSLTTGKRAAADADITCMAVAALSAAKSALKDDGRIQKAIDSALKYLADNEDKVKKTSESVSQYIIALCAEGSDKAALWAETLLGHRLADGTFRHESGGKSDAMATEQALLALTAYVKGERVY